MWNTFVDAQLLQWRCAIVLKDKRRRRIIERNMHSHLYFCSKQLRPPSREFQFCRHRSRSAGGTITIPILPLEEDVLPSVALQEAVRLFCLSLYTFRMLSLCWKIVNFILWTVSLFASLAPSQFINVSSGLLVLTFNHLKLNLLRGNIK